jgi:hypothetical protein
MAVFTLFFPHTFLAVYCFALKGRKLSSSVGADKQIFSATRFVCYRTPEKKKDVFATPERRRNEWK